MLSVVWCWLHYHKIILIQFIRYMFSVRQTGLRSIFISLLTCSRRLCYLYDVFTTWYKFALLFICCCYDVIHICFAVYMIFQDVIQICFAVYMICFLGDTNLLYYWYVLWRDANVLKLHFIIDVISQLWLYCKCAFTVWINECAAHLLCEHFECFYNDFLIKLHSLHHSEFFYLIRMNGVS